MVEIIEYEDQKWERIQDTNTQLVRGWLIIYPSGRKEKVSGWEGDFIRSVLHSNYTPTHGQGENRFYRPYRKKIKLR